MSSNFNPLAETFTVSAVAFPQGCFITSVDLFFSYASPNETYPVEVRLVETLNGYPTSKMLPNASSLVSAATIIANTTPVSISSMISNTNDSINSIEANILNIKNLVAQLQSSLIISSASAFGGNATSISMQISAGNNAIAALNTELSTKLAYLKTLNSQQATSSSYKINFKFPSLIQLKSGVEYAIVVLSNSMTYKIWTAVIGQPRIDNPAVLITQQPAVGAMFKSQNGSTWTPEQTQDLSFNLNRAVFSLNEKSNITLVDSPLNGFVTLPPNPFKLTTGQSIVKVHHINHGLAVGMLVSYYNSIDPQFNNTNFTVYSIVDSDYYTISTSVQTTTNYVGGGIVMTEKVTKFGSISIPNMPIGSDVGLQVSFKASTVGFVDTTPTQLAPGDLLNLSVNKYVQSSINETAQLMGANSFTLNASLSSLNNAVSPAIDINSISVSLMSNRINYPSPNNVNYDIDGTVVLTGASNITFYSTDNTIAVPNTTDYTQLVLGAWIRITDVGGSNNGATGYISAIDTTNNQITLVGTPLIGENDRSAIITQYLSYIDETQNGGSADSKYITVPVELPTLNTGFRVMVSLNVPVNTDIAMYHRTGLQSSAIKLANNSWANALITYKYSVGESDFIDYEYDITNLASYDEFQFKFVFLSNTSSSPKIKNLRIIAHA